MKNKLPPQLTLLLLSLSLACVYLFGASQSPFFLPLRFNTQDLVFKFRADHSRPLGHLNNLVIVGVDDDSYRRMNRAWPWGRDVFAVFLENAQKLNPKAVGFDFTFVGRSPNPELDKWLSDAVSSKKNVVLASYFDMSGQHIVPLDLISGGARGHGFLEKPVDKDAINRRTRALVKQPGGPVYSFAAWAASAFLGALPRDIVRVEAGRLLFSYAGGQGAASLVTEVKTDAEGYFPMSYRYRPKSFLYLPFWRIVAQEVPKAELEGKILLVGPVMPLLHDIHDTPLGLMPGTCIVANEILMLLDHDFVREVPPAWQYLIFLLIALLLTLVFERVRFTAGLAMLGASVAAAVAAALSVFTAHNIYFDLFSLVWVILTSYLFVILYKSFVTFMENLTLQRLVIIDTLTGLYGYRYLTIRLETEYNKALRDRKEFFVVMIDVDFFKKVNDMYGHETGNEVLSGIAKILKGGVRGYDVAARYGGEEFGLLLFHNDEKEILQTVERIRGTVEKRIFSANGTDFHVTISAGICSNHNPQVRSKDDLIKCADAALYQAKSGGRNRVCMYKVGA